MKKQATQIQVNQMLQHGLIVTRNEFDVNQYRKSNNVDNGLYDYCSPIGKQEDNGAVHHALIGMPVNILFYIMNDGTIALTEEDYENSTDDFIELSAANGLSDDINK